MDFWDINTVRSNPDKIFIFGDNEQGWGKGGQAIIRDESNAFGIPIKRAPSWNPDAFWYDEDIEQHKPKIDRAIAKIPRDRQWILPSGGIGTGRGKPKQGTNKKTVEYLRQQLLAICTGD